MDGYGAPAQPGVGARFPTKDRMYLMGGAGSVMFFIAMGVFAIVEYSRAIGDQWLSTGSWVIMLGIATGLCAIWLTSQWSVVGIGSSGPLMALAAASVGVAFFAMLDRDDIRLTNPTSYAIRFRENLAAPIALAVVSLTYVMSTTIALYGGGLRGTIGALSYVAGRLTESARVGRLGFADGSFSGAQSVVRSQLAMGYPAPCITCVLDFNACGGAASECRMMSAATDFPHPNHKWVGYCSPDHRTKSKELEMFMTGTTNSMGAMGIQR